MYAILGKVFFKPTRGLKQGFPFSPYLFVLVAKQLSTSISKAKRTRIIHDIRIGGNELLTHLLFVDDVLWFCNGNYVEEGRKIRDSFHLYNKATRMEIIFTCLLWFLMSLMRKL